MSFLRFLGKVFQHVDRIDEFFEFLSFHFTIFLGTSSNASIELVGFEFFVFTMSSETPSNMSIELVSF